MRELNRVKSSINKDLTDFKAGRLDRSGKAFTDVFLKGGASDGLRTPTGAIPMPPGKIKVSDLPKTARPDAGPGAMSRRVALINMRKDMEKRNKEVTETLKVWYNESDTPIKDRWYPGGS